MLEFFLKIIFFKILIKYVLIFIIFFKFCGIVLKLFFWMEEIIDYFNLCKCVYF